MLARIWAVAMRDFNAVVRTKGFVIGLLFLPCLTLLSLALPKLLAGFGEKGERRYAVADFTGALQPALDTWAKERNARPGQKLTVAFEPFDLAARGFAGKPLASVRGDLEQELAVRVRRGELYGWLVLGPRLAEIPPPPDDVAARAAWAAEAKLVYGAVSLTAGELRRELKEAVRLATRQRRLAEAQLDAALLARIETGFETDEFVVSKEAKEGGGVERSSGAAEAIIPLSLVVLLMMGIMQSAGVLLNATIEEKSNRVVEVLVSSISSMELLAGKVVGSFLTGVIVLLAWGGAAGFAADHFQVLRTGTLSLGNVVGYAYFFVGGYLLFGSLYLAIGAMCNSIQDAQNMMLPVVMLIMLPMLGMTHVISHPDSAFARALTFFPFSAPMIMPMRLAQTPAPPAWQVATSAASVALGVLFCLWAAAKVFRVAIFSAGKPPKLSELWRWLREAS